MSCFILWYNSHPHWLWGCSHSNKTYVANISEYLGIRLKSITFIPKTIYFLFILFSPRTFNLNTRGRPADKMCFHRERLYQQQVVSKRLKETKTATIYQIRQRLIECETVDRNSQSFHWAVGTWWMERNVEMPISPMSFISSGVTHTPATHADKESLWRELVLNMLLMRSLFIFSGTVKKIDCFYPIRPFPPFLMLHMECCEWKCWK